MTLSPGLLPVLFEEHGASGGAEVDPGTPVDGGAVLSGEAFVLKGAIVDLTLKWRVSTFSQVDYTFLWSTGRLPLFWYRVLGKDKTNVCPPIQVEPCCMKYVTNLFARSITELCEKLKKRKWQWPIESVEKFSRPADQADQDADAALGINHDCNVTEIVEICDNPICGDFCVDLDLQQRVGVVVRLQVNAFFSHEATGSIFMAGTAPASSMGQVFDEEAEDGVELAGTAEEFVFTEFGGATAGGAAQVKPFVEEGHDGLIGGGAAESTSSAWQYTGSGGVTIEPTPSAILVVGWVYNPLGGVTVNDRALITFDVEAIGGAIVNGMAKAEPYFLEGSGGVGAGGEAEAKPFVEFGKGGAGAGGEVEFEFTFNIESEDGVDVGGDGLLFTTDSYTASGPVVTGGVAGIKSSAWQYTGSGGVDVGGEAFTFPLFLGDKFIKVEADFQILDLTFVFSEDEPDELESPATNIDRCNCFGIPLEIEFSHDLARNNIFTNFLARNNLGISQDLRLVYNTTNNSWQRNLHYTGRSPDSVGEETWDLLFEFECTNFLGVELGVEVWKLAVQIVRRIEGRTDEDYDTRILVSINKEPACSSGFLEFRVTYDTQTDLVETAPDSVLFQNFIHDNIGMFKNQLWERDPNLNFRISESGFEIPIRTVNIDALLPTEP